MDREHSKDGRGYLSIAEIEFVEGRWQAWAEHGRYYIANSECLPKFVAHVVVRYFREDQFCQYIPLEKVAALRELVRELDDIKDVDHAPDNASFAGRIDSELWDKVKPG